MALRLLVALALALPAGLNAQEARKPEPKIDQKRVDEAIHKGVAFLKTQTSIGAMGTVYCGDLLLLVYLKAGVAENDAKVQEVFQRALSAELKTTYQAVLHAMMLEELDRVKYQERLWRCGQFLADNHCKNGQWSYGEPTTYGIPTARTRGTATAGSGRKTSRTEPGGKRPKPAVVRELLIAPSRPGPDVGDNSNSQYAALGLRACRDAGIVFPKKIVEAARQWWVESQSPTEARIGAAAGAGAAPPGATAAENLRGGEVRGWNYDNLATTKETPPFAKGQGYASMTAGAVGAIVIYDSMLGKDWKKDLSVLTGMNWLAHYFKVDENYRGGHGSHRFQYYYLYAVERVGMLYGTEFLGTHEWYTEGARYLT